MKNYSLKLLQLVLLSAVSSGCISFTSPHHERRPAFVVVCQRPGERATSNPQATTTLRIRRFRSAEPFDTRRMMELDEKTGQIKIIKEGEFAVSVSTTSSDAFRRWLDLSGRFAGVLDSSAVSSGHAVSLDGWIDQACVVVDPSGKKTFRLALSVWLSEGGNGAGASDGPFSNAYVQSVALESSEPKAIAEAFGKALTEVLTEFEKSLADRLK